MPNTIVIAWSGGPESTYLLKKALEKGKDVIAVHVGDSLDKYYTKACFKATNILQPLLSQIKPFDCVRYVMKAANSKAETTDEVVALVMCAALAYENPVICWGSCKEDSEEQSWANQNKHLVQRQEAMLKGVVKEYYVHRKVPKSEICLDLDYMWPLTWSCLYPTEDLRQCGYCMKCKERRKAEIEARNILSERNKNAGTAE